MRKPSQLQRNNEKEIEPEVSDKIKIVLNILDNLIGGQRFGEYDTAKLMYLMDCQSRINDMQNGYFKESDIRFLDASIESLIRTLMDAKNELHVVTKYFEEE